MPTLTDIRVGLAANLSALEGIDASPYMLAQPIAPAIQVIPSEVLYDQTMARGYDQWTLLVQAFVGSVASQATQEALDAMLAPAGASSVKQAIESDKTLGGAAADLRVTSSTGYQQFVNQTTNTPLLMAEWTVEVLAEGA